MIPRHAGPHSWETLPPEQIDPATMHAAARWLDAEYLRYAMLVPKGDGAQEIDGRMTARARSSALFRAPTSASPGFGGHGARLLAPV
jgi:hypothetical protein